MKIHQASGIVGKKRRAVPFSVFIGYADVPAVRRATTTIADAVRSTRHKFVIQPMLWRFSQMTSPHWHDRAIEAAQTADVVVLASSAPSGLSHDVERWVDAFVAARQGRKTTIVAVIGENDAWTITLEEPKRQKPKSAQAVVEASLALPAFIPIDN